METPSTHACRFFQLESSVSYSKKNMILTWQNFTMDPGMYFPKFRIYDYETLESCPGIYTDKDRSCVRASLKMSRKFSFYMTRFYAPTILIVCATFIGFWLPISSWPARVSVVLTPFLSLITMHNSINSEIKVSYVVAIHIWMFFCMFFTFMGLIEYSIVLIQDHKHRKEVERKMREKDEKYERERLKANEKNNNKKKIANPVSIEAEEGYFVTGDQKEKDIPTENGIKDASEEKTPGKGEETKESLDNNETKEKIPLPVAKYLSRWWKSNDLRSPEMQLNDEKKHPKVKIVTVACHTSFNSSVCSDYEERNPIDKTARIVFPLCFLLFIIGYFAAFMPSWLSRN